MLILSSPSGAGKTTLTRMLLQMADIDLTLSVSVTTRPRRQSEVDGVHYHFLTQDRFRELRDAGELLEWAEVHGNFYGTPKGPVDALLRDGRDVLFDIDYQGTQQIRGRARDDVATIFILPPSMRELRARLERRAEDKPDVIARRLEAARNEITRWTLYDYVLVNDDLQRTLRDVVAILSAERLRRLRTEPAVAGFVAALAAEG
ncbi:guanylate kinase [Lichenibacterium ramalinae]|uniref:Guanylate kinase n=2 Tax=Lichenibacterium ramalinae TaxID=2316527 RepID=A0A4Q2RGC6_9HYPH|nr:guanylate kinase [Lichenibacterium ramalinae]